MSALSGRRRPLQAMLFALLCMASVAGDGATRGPLALSLDAPAWRGDLDGIRQRRLLRVLVPYSRTLYFVDYGGQQRGLSYDTLRAFEAELNRAAPRGSLPVHAVFIPVARDRLIPLLLAGQGDVVAANLTVTDERARQVAFTAPFARGVSEVVVSGPGAPPLASLDDLSGRSVMVRPGSSYEESLRTLNADLRRRGKAPVMVRPAPAHFEAEDLLEMVNAGLAPLTVCDDYLAGFWSQVFPSLVLHPQLALRTDGEIAFAVRPGSPQLKAALDAFAATHRAGTLFGNVVLRKYLQGTKWARNALATEDRSRFLQMVALFRRYGERYGVDWLLMAAQGYQESQLDQQRRSRVGAIGVMQLMPATGRQMAVGDITQLEPNIHAGVKYVRTIVDTYFDDPGIDAVNRLLFGFAAYNAGPGRVRALRAEAASRGLDRNRWFDNVERIAAERIGAETVQYVANIYKYYVAYTLVQEEVGRDLGRTADVH